MAVAWICVAPAPTPLPPLSGTLERLIVEKAARRLTLVQAGKPVRHFRGALGLARFGDMARKDHWTAGCIAVSNVEMRETWAATDSQTQVEVRP